MTPCDVMADSILSPSNNADESSHAFRFMLICRHSEKYQTIYNGENAVYCIYGSRSYHRLLLDACNIFITREIILLTKGMDFLMVSI